MVLTAPLNFYYPQTYFSKMRKNLQQLYFYPSIILIICFIISLSELIVFKKVSYGFYFLFYGPLIVSLLNFFKMYGETSFVIDVCKSDYLLMHFENPHYPKSFWIVMENPKSLLGFEISLTENDSTQYSHRGQQVILRMSKWDSQYRLKLLLRVSGIAFNKSNRSYNIIKNHFKYPLKTRLKAAYFKDIGVRWFHTTRILYYPSPKNATPIFHSITKKLCRDVYDYLALMDTNIHYFEIEKLVNALNNIHDHNDYFSAHPNILISPKSNQLAPLIESAQAMSHKPLADTGVISGTIPEMRSAFPKEDFPSMQRNPDVGHHFHQSSFAFKNTIGVDFKNIMGKAMYSNRNQISIGDYITYDFLFDEFTRMFTRKHPTLIHSLQPFFDDLRDYAKKDLWDKQLLLWANNLHLLPPRWAPPLYTKKNLPLDAFKTEPKTKILLARKRLLWLSEKAKELTISEKHFTQQDVIKLEQSEALEYKTPTLTPDELAHLAEVMRLD